jgi:uncharacterized membrane protein YbhN (UPF0104 family)
MRNPLPRSTRGRLILLGVLLAVSAALVAWHHPEFNLLEDAFTAVSWFWVGVAVVVNLLSVAVRASAWRVVITHAIPSPFPRWRVVFSAFSSAMRPCRAGSENWHASP